MPSLCLFYLFRRFLAENLKHLNQNLLLQWECSNIKTYFFLVNRLIFNFKAYSSMLQNVKLGLFSIPEQRPLLSFLEYTLGKTFLNINKSKLPSKGLNVTTSLKQEDICRSRHLGKIPVEDDPRKDESFFTCKYFTSVFFHY